MRGTFLAVQWLKLCASNAGGMGLIPGRGNKIPHGKWPKFFFLKRKKDIKSSAEDFIGGPVVKNSPANTGDKRLIPDLRRPHMQRSN